MHHSLVRRVARARASSIAHSIAHLQRYAARDPT